MCISFLHSMDNWCHRNWKSRIHFVFVYLKDLWSLNEHPWQPGGKGPHYLCDKKPPICGSSKQMIIPRIGTWVTSQARSGDGQSAVCPARSVLARQWAVLVQELGSEMSWSRSITVQGYKSGVGQRIAGFFKVCDMEYGVFCKRLQGTEQLLQAIWSLYSQRGMKLQ